MTLMTQAATSYATLSPDMVLDALDSAGLRGDGRLLALNSYENRVYQIGIEDGPPLVAKFYRPGRWSDAQILEEHAFVAELVEREIPVVPAMALDGACCAIVIKRQKGQPRAADRNSACTARERRLPRAARVSTRHTGRRNLK